MSPTPLPHPMLRLVQSSRLLAGLAFVFVLATLVTGLANSPSARASVITPTLQRAATILPGGMVTVHGAGFSPGGLVEIVVVHQSDETLVHTSFWAVASSEAHGPHGTQDPARGYVPAGSFTTIIDLEVTAIHGPHGSQDPAQGYQPALSVGDVLHAGEIVVQAFDHQTGISSDRLAVDPGVTRVGFDHGFFLRNLPRTCVMLTPCYLP